jgi:hypothetical protein
MNRDENKNEVQKSKKMERKKIEFKHKSSKI